MGDELVRIQTTNCMRTDAAQVYAQAIIRDLTVICIECLAGAGILVPK